jgi:hypothetical protein
MQLPRVRSGTLILLVVIVALAVALGVERRKSAPLRAELAKARIWSFPRWRPAAAFSAEDVRGLSGSLPPRHP